MFLSAESRGSPHLYGVQRERRTGKIAHLVSAVQGAIAVNCRCSVKMREGPIRLARYSAEDIVRAHRRVSG